MFHSNKLVAILANKGDTSKEMLSRITLMLENVPFMLRLERGEAMRYLTHQLDDMGFMWAYRVIDTRAFGSVKSVLAISSKTTASRVPTRPTRPVLRLIKSEAGVALPPERTWA